MLARSKEDLKTGERGKRAWVGGWVGVRERGRGEERERRDHYLPALSPSQHSPLLSPPPLAVALGTSKINYMDPRISIAWCKRNEVPLEKIFNKSLLAKFSWAMEVSEEEGRRAGGWAGYVEE